MDVTALLALVDDLYPNAESASTKVRYMNIAMKDLSQYFGKIVEDATLVTVADQDSYTYPTGLTAIEQIESLAVANQATPENRYDYTQYRLSKSEYHPMSYNSYFEIISDSGAKKLCLYPVPSEDDLPIVIRYRTELPELDSTKLTEEPEFDSKYHEALAFYCLHMIAMQGASPDRVQADAFMRKYDDIETKLWKGSMEIAAKKRKKPRDNPQWHKNRSYARGFEDA